jgi:diguanylate cyclase (GGDEF)-like protein
VAIHSYERLDDNLAELVKAGGSKLGILEVVFLDSKGRLVAHSASDVVQHMPAGVGGVGETIVLEEAFLSRAVGSTGPLWRRAKREDGRAVLQVSMPAISGLRWGTLVAAFDLKPVLDQIAWARLILLFIAIGFTIVLTLVLYLVLSHMVIRPIRVLASAVNNIQEGFLGARADVMSRDELGQLAHGFNSMASELQSYTASLERKVAERSAMIQAKNSELEKLNKELEGAVQQLDRLARTDELTQVYNRRHLRHVLDFEIRRGTRSFNRLMVAMVDVDHFKLINDTHGHHTGDLVLRELADLMVRHLRATDIVSRFGGEEFVILLLDTGDDAGLPVAEKIRRLVEEHAFFDTDGRSIGTVTVSIGLVSFPSHGETSPALLKSVDTALYQAKSKGRNCVVSWPRVDSSQDKSKDS